MITTLFTILINLMISGGSPVEQNAQSKITAENKEQTVNAYGGTSTWGNADYADSKP